MATSTFPDNFLFGAATAAHQIEGNNTNSDWWAFEHDPNSGCRDSSGDACDSWHRWDEDLALVQSLGLNAYRFSVEWARVEPAPGEFSLVALDHYRRIVERCHERGLVPVVTLHHFTIPRWMSERGGFESPEIAQRLGSYTERVTAAIGDGIGLACTINEPNVVALMGYLLGVFPPSVRDRARFEVVSEATRTSHRAMVDALRAGPGQFPVGLTLSMAEMEAIEGGEAQYLQALEHLEDAYLRAVGGDDFIGVQCYTRLRFGPDGPVDIPAGARRTMMGYEFRPEVVEHTVRRAAAVSGLPVVVTETGISADDDTERIEFIDSAMRGVAACIADGLDVRGFFYWTLLDNFEWVLGYSQPFGIVAVDRQSFARTPKPSATHLGRIARSRELSTPVVADRAQ
jgi:beta-glucosidase